MSEFVALVKAGKKALTAVTATSSEEAEEDHQELEREGHSGFQQDEATRSRHDAQTAVQETSASTSEYNEVLVRERQRCAARWPEHLAFRQDAAIRTRQEAQTDVQQTSASTSEYNAALERERQRCAARWPEHSAFLQDEATGRRQEAQTTVEETTRDESKDGMEVIEDISRRFDAMPGKEMDVGQAKTGIRTLSTTSNLSSLSLHSTGEGLSQSPEGATATLPPFNSVIESRRGKFYSPRKSLSKKELTKGVKQVQKALAIALRPQAASSKRALSIVDGPSIADHRPKTPKRGRPAKSPGAGVTVQSEPKRRGRPPKSQGAGVTVQSQATRRSRSPSPASVIGDTVDMDLSFASGNNADDSVDISDVEALNIDSGEEEDAAVTHPVRTGGGEGPVLAPSVADGTGGGEGPVLAPSVADGTGGGEGPVATQSVATGTADLNQADGYYAWMQVDIFKYVNVHGHQRGVFLENEGSSNCAQPRIAYIWLVTLKIECCIFYHRSSC